MKSCYSKEMEARHLLDIMQGSSKLSNFVNVVPGFYPMQSAVFAFKDRLYKNGKVDECYSSQLERYVPIEKDAIRPMIHAGRINDFMDAKYKQFETHVLVADYHAEYFTQRYPYAAEYLKACSEDVKVRMMLQNDSLIRDGMRAVMDESKLIVSTYDKLCHAMIDEQSHVISSVYSYLIIFPFKDVRLYKAYAAIINSKLFSYIFYHRLKDVNEIRHGRMGILREMQVPFGSNEGYEVLANLAECLFWLCRPNQPQLSQWINDRIRYYLTELMNMVVYEMYFPSYVHERNLDIIVHMQNAPFMFTMLKEEERIYQTYHWFQRSNNIVRQKMELIDTRSPELLYIIQNFKGNE